MLARERRPTDPTGRPERDVARIAEDVRRLLAKAGVAPSEVAGAGVSAPGPMDVAALPMPRAAAKRPWTAK